MALLRVLRKPIVEQQVERLRTLIDRPIKLRHQIVEPAFGEPQLDICVQLVVLAETGNARRTAVRATQAERADAETHPRLLAVNAIVDAFHQQIDIAASPIGARQPAAQIDPSLPGGVVRKVLLDRRHAAGKVYRVGVEIVIDVYAVDVVSTHHVEDDIQRPLCSGILAGIHPQIAAIALHHLRVGVGDMHGRVRRFRRSVSRTIGIEPGMQFDAALMRLFDPHFQRVVIGVGHLALLAHQILGPRL